MSKALDFDTFCNNLHQVYLLEVGRTQSPVDHEIFFIVCHVGIHVSLSSMTIFFGTLRASPFSVK
jgi:hypothetical protein